MSGKVFFVFAVVLGVVDLLVPLLLLASIGSFLASFLFWCVLTAAMIVFAAVATRTWRDQ